MRRRLADTESNTVRHLRDTIRDRKPPSIHFRAIGRVPWPPMSLCRSIYRCTREHRPPSHSSKDGSVYRTRWWTDSGVTPSVGVGLVYARTGSSSKMSKSATKLADEGLPLRDGAFLERLSEAGRFSLELPCWWAAPPTAVARQRGQEQG